MAEERTPNRILVGLMVIVLITVSAVIGLVVANWPECVRYFAARH